LQLLLTVHYEVERVCICSVGESTSIKPNSKGNSVVNYINYCGLALTLGNRTHVLQKKYGCGRFCDAHHSASAISGSSLYFCSQGM